MKQCDLTQLHLYTGKHVCACVRVCASIGFMYVRTVIECVFLVHTCIRIALCDRHTTYMLICGTMSSV